MSHWWWQQGI